MDNHEWVTEQFERHRIHLRGVAYRILGSLSEADDAVQEAWLRLSRSDASVVKNSGGLADDRDRPGVPRRPSLTQVERDNASMATRPLSN
jgi:hypothetical protein